MTEIRSVSTNKFKYTPLSPGSCIRVLKVEAGQESDDIVCTLSDISLEDNHHTEYEAISYVWGDPAKTHRVICDGVPLGITANLHAAIRTFRHSDRSRVLWTDAICIDQGNVPERNMQVALMKDVYAQAQQVLVWLGERDDRDDDAFTLIKALTPYFERNEKPSALPPLWPCLRSLLERPWFTRTWIVQEAGNAQKGVIVWGGRSVDLEEFLGVASGIRQRNPLLSELLSDSQLHIVDYEKLSRAMSCLETIRLWRAKTNLGLISWLSYTRDLDATDPRDKVFWHYGYLHDSLKNQFPIDYSSNVVTVYQNLTTALLGSDGLNILGYVSRSHRPSQTSVPSWVPNWTMRQYGVSLSSFLRHSNASGEKPISFSSVQNVLKIGGIEFDKVSILAPPLSDLEKSDDLDVPGGPAHFLQWLVDAKSMTAQSGRYTTNESIETAFWKALICDTGPDGNVAPNEYSGHLEEYKNYMHLQSQTEKSRIGWVSADHRHTFESALKFADLFHKVSNGRLFCVMKSGCIGWTPLGTQPGDLVCILYGGRVPYVIRPADENNYTFIGECYVHGMMYGDASDVDGAKEKEFWLK